MKDVTLTGDHFQQMPDTILTLNVDSAIVVVTRLLKPGIIEYVFTVKSHLPEFRKLLSRK